MSIQNSENFLEAKPTPYEIVSSMSLPSQPGVFVLGCFERRVTLYHQQTRALNLVYALHRLGYLGSLENENLEVGSPNSKVEIAVVGAGVAGLTAAAALSRYGNCHVTVLERENKILPVLDRFGVEGRWGRYLSPYLYEWPASSKFDSEVMPEGEPLSWRPEYQKKVVEELKDKWDKEIEERDNVKVILGASSVRLCKGNGSSSGVSLSWDDFGFYHESRPPQDKIKNKKSFKYVILAIGFGFDKVSIGDLETPSYWDSLPYSVEGNEENKEYLISGTGDGGWTDLFGIALGNAFNQESFTEDFLDKCLTEETIEELIGIEEEAKLRRALNEDERQFLRAEYNELNKKGWFDILRKKVNEIYEKNSKPKLSLQVRTQNYLSLNAFMANRVLGFCLVASEANQPETKGIVELLIGDIVDIKKHQAESEASKSRYLVILDDGSEEYITREFDEVLLRHGPGRNNAFEKFDQSLFRENRSALRKVAQIDRTAIVAWPEDYFEKKIYGSPEPLESPLIMGSATRRSAKTYIKRIQNEFLGPLSDSEILTMASSNCYQIDPLREAEPIMEGAESISIINDTRTTDVTFVFSSSWRDYMNRVFLAMCITQSYQEPNKFKLVELEEKPYLFVPLSARMLREVLQEEEVQGNLNKLISTALEKSYGLELNPDPVQFAKRMGMGMLIVLLYGNLDSGNAEHGGILNSVIKILKDYPPSISIRLIILSDHIKPDEIDSIKQALNEKSISNSMVKVRFYERVFTQALVQELMGDPEAEIGHAQTFIERIPEPKKVTAKFIEIVRPWIDEFLDNQQDNGRLEFWRRFQDELMTQSDSVRRSDNKKISNEEISSVLPKIGYLLTAGTNSESLGHRAGHGSYSSATIDELRNEIGKDCLRAMLDDGILISNRAGYSFWGDYLANQEHFSLPVENFSEYLAGEYLAQDEHRDILRNYLQETEWISGRKKYALLFALEIVLEQCSDSKSRLDILNELVSPLFDRVDKELGAVYFLNEVMVFGLELLPQRKEHVVSLLLNWDLRRLYSEDIDEYFEQAIKMAKKEEHGRILKHLRGRARDNNDLLQVDAASAAWEVTQSNEDKEQIVELSKIPIETQNADESSKQNRINLNKKSEAIRTLLRIGKNLDKDLKKAIFSLKDRYPYRYETLLIKALGYSSKEDRQELLDKLLELSRDEELPDTIRQEAAVFLLRFKWMREQAIASLLNLIKHSEYLSVYENVFRMLVRHLGQEQREQLEKIIREKMDSNSSEEIRLGAIESWKKISPEDKTTVIDGYLTLIWDEKVGAITRLEIATKIIDNYFNELNSEQRVKLIHFALDKKASPVENNILTEQVKVLKAILKRGESLEETVKNDVLHALEKIKSDKEVIAEVRVDALAALVFGKPLSTKVRELLEFSQASEDRKISLYCGKKFGEWNAIWEARHFNIKIANEALSELGRLEQFDVWLDASLAGEFDREYFET